MTLASLQRALAGVDRLALDTNVFIAAADARDPRRHCATWLLEAVQRGDFRCVISTINAAEILVGAVRAGWEASTAAQAHLRSFPHLEVVALTFDLAVDAAHVRAATKLPLPDSVVLATAIASSCQAIVHADREWVRRAQAYASGLRMVYLGDHCP